MTADSFIPRFTEPRIRSALKDTRVVMLAGPRQAGKTTLARMIAGNDLPFLTLDNAGTLDAARSDPIGFVRNLDRAVIDEVQRSPDLLLAIKESVDADRRPGRFLITGSANIMTLPRVADSLAGRMEIIRLLPLAQAEIEGRSTRFIDRAFANERLTTGGAAGGSDLVERALAGGYPEALSRSSWRRRRDWYVNYVDAIVQRDVRDIAQVDQLGQMPRLLQALAGHAGQLANLSRLGAYVGMNHVTTKRYVGILESLFLVHALQPWFSNKLKRLVKTPKLHFLDAGLLAALSDSSPQSIARDRTAFGPILETFVLAELLKIASWSESIVSFSHFRDSNGNEVDIVLEDRAGRLVGVEVKAAATVGTKDFSGLRHLAEASGKRFVAGYVLYDHDTIIPFGDRLAAVPLSALWG